MIESYFPLLPLSFAGTPAATTSALFRFPGTGAISDFYDVCWVFDFLFLFSPIPARLFLVFYVYLDLVSSRCRSGIGLHVSTHCGFGPV